MLRYYSSLAFASQQVTLFSSWLSFIVDLKAENKNWNFGRIMRHTRTPFYAILRPDFSADFLRRKSSLFARSLTSVSFLQMSKITEIMACAKMLFDNSNFISYIAIVKCYLNIPNLIFFVLKMVL